MGRDDGKEAGEYAAIFYNKNEIEKLKMAISGSQRILNSLNWAGTLLVFVSVHGENSSKKQRDLRSTSLIFTPTMLALSHVVRLQSW